VTNYTTRDPRPVNRDPVRVKRGLLRDYIIKSLLALLDHAERPGWWGEVGIAVVVQNGRAETIKKRTEQTEKGTP